MEKREGGIDVMGTEVRWSVRCGRERGGHRTDGREVGR